MIFVTLAIFFSIVPLGGVFAANEEINSNRETYLDVAKNLKKSLFSEDTFDESKSSELLIKDLQVSNNEINTNRNSFGVRLLSDWFSNKTTKIKNLYFENEM